MNPARCAAQVLHLLRDEDAAATEETRAPEASEALRRLRLLRARTPERRPWLDPPKARKGLKLARLTLLPSRDHKLA